MIKLIIKFAMFASTQNVYLQDENNKIHKYIVPMNDLPNFIAKSKCDEVYAYGIRPFCEKFEREVNKKLEKNKILWYYNNEKKMKEIIENNKEKKED